MSSFEMAMPVVGLLLGHALGCIVGHAADYIAIGVLALLGVWMLVHDEEDEGGKVDGLMRGQGLALLALGFSISLDELAIGFTIGLLHLSLWLAVILIGAQAFLFAQMGLRLGAGLSETLRERAEQLAGVALLGLAVSSLLRSSRDPGAHTYARSAHGTVAAMTDTSLELSAATRRLLLRRGLRLEYATLAWNVVGSVLVLVAAAAACSVALAGFGFDSLIEIVASAVVVWQLKGTDKGRERKALRVIGVAFILLALYIAAQSSKSANP
jgi:manganese efflux pump family protein